MSIKEEIAAFKAALPSGVTVVAVSKMHAPAEIMEAYDGGQRLFGESRVQELTAKYETLPKDIEWHMIGHLQTNKVKYIAPFVSMVQSVDSARLIGVIDEQARRHGRTIDILLEVHVAREESKDGWREADLTEWVASGAWRDLVGVRVRGVMGMATFTDNAAVVRGEFLHLHEIFTTLRPIFGPAFDTLSMGMSGDWPLAVECGSTMLRIGSLFFDTRT